MAFLFLLPTCKTLAYTPKEGNVTMYAGPFFSQTNYQSDDGRNPTLRNLGLVINGDINSHSSLEIGIFNMRKNFFRSSSLGTIAERIEQVHITMGYRHWFNSYSSGSISFFSGYAIGQPTTTFNSFTPGTEFSTSADDRTEYGLDFALQVELFEYRRFGLTLDGRYSLSVTNKTGESADHIGALLGLRYHIQ